MVNVLVKTSKHYFALCIDNSLIPKKIYEILPDEKAAEDDLLRIVDESGEDYLYHSSYFVLVDIERVLMAS